ncbi:MAG: GNAT family N-acetyltransferase [Frankia sp.]|nr:GNAT family N-acetyltransferase [Frankia sp.]
MPFAIRRADSADAPTLADLQWRWRVTERSDEPATSSANEFRDSLATWWGAHPGHRAWLAEDDDGAAIGVAWLAVADRVPAPARAVRRHGWVQSVYVVPERRNDGVGAALMAAIRAEAIALDLDYVTVHPSTRSFAFYRRAGFADAPGLLEMRFEDDPATRL